MGVGYVGYMLAILRRAADAVFGAVEGDQLAEIAAVQLVGGGLQERVDSGMVGDQANAPAADSIRFGRKQAFAAELYATQVSALSCAAWLRRTTKAMPPSKLARMPAI